MTAPKQGSDQATKQQDELELKKQTLKDLPATGEDVKGGRATTVNTLTPPGGSTVICR